MRFSSRFPSLDVVFQVMLVLQCLAVGAVLFTYAYGGLYSRYLADDYCASVLLLSSPTLFESTLAGYNTWFNAYTILVFVQLVDWAGIWGFRLMSGVTILLWTASLAWLFAEIGRGIKQRLGFAVNPWLAGTVVFLSLYQAPNLYQILYWRTSLIPYTLPLVFFIGTAAFLLRYARLPYQKSRALWMGAISLILVFAASGLGETTSAMQIGLLFAAVVVVWLTKPIHRRMDVLNILLASLATAIISLLIIAFSPGTINRLDRIMEQTPLYNPVTLSIQTLTYTFQFLWDHLRSAPLPALIMIFLPLAVMYVRNTNADSNHTSIGSSRFRLALLLVPLLMIIVIGFSFAPSAFVRSFPVGRARFASIVILTLCLALEGGLLGMILASRLRSTAGNVYVRGAALALLAVLIFYPLRAAPRVYAATNEYRYCAAAWDARNAGIRQAMAEGAADLVVVQLDSIGGVGEYKGNERDWINRCAARFYGLNTLRAP
jgi:hypothetical protein